MQDQRGQDRGRSPSRGQFRMPGRSGGRGKVGGGFAIIAIIVALLLGVDPTQILNLVGGAEGVLPGPSAPSASANRDVGSDEGAQRAAVVLASTEDAWNRVFQQAGSRYLPPQMVLFTDGVQVELQADCYAGIWANHAAKDGDFLETGDLEEGLRAAAAIGDDRLQKMSGRRVQPESFTHGSSEQRQEWFTRGLRSGDFATCDTFN